MPTSLQVHGSACTYAPPLLSEAAENSHRALDELVGAVLVEVAHPCHRVRLGHKLGVRATLDVGARVEPPRGSFARRRVGRPAAQLVANGSVE